MTEDIADRLRTCIAKIDHVFSDEAAIAGRFRVNDAVATANEVRAELQRIVDTLSTPTKGDGK